MATLYVSQSTQNGYVVGADANNGTAKGTPKLTVEGAIAAAADGDTITINSGVYTHASFFDTGAKALTFVEEVAGTVELRATTATAGTAVLLMQTPAAGAAALPAFLVNARGIQDYCVKFTGSGAIRSVVFNGTVFKDPLVRAVNDALPNHTVTLTNVVLWALSLTSSADVLRRRIYQADSHLSGAITMSGKVLQAADVSLSVSAALNGSTNKTDYL